MFTVDSQEQLSDNKCPMLDLKVWKEKDHGGQTVIRHTFYEKEVTSPIVFHARGAHTWRSKLVTLLEEVNRRLRNMDRKHPRKDVLEVLRKFAHK